MNKKENKHAVVKISEDKSWFFKTDKQRFKILMTLIKEKNIMN